MGYPAAIELPNPGILRKVPSASYLVAFSKRGMIYRNKSQGYEIL